MQIDKTPSTREELDKKTTKELKAILSFLTDKQVRSNKRDYLIRRILQRLEAIALQARAEEVQAKHDAEKAAGEEEEVIVYDAAPDLDVDIDWGDDSPTPDEEDEHAEQVAQGAMAGATQGAMDQGASEQEAAEEGIRAYERVKHQQREQAKPRPPARPKAPSEPTQPNNDLQATLRAEAEATVEQALADAGVEKLTKLDVEPLRDLYEQVIGRATSSTNHAYLVWKLREALKGNIPLGAHRGSGRPRGSGKAAKKKVIPIGLEEAAVDAMDDAWKKAGFPSRVAFIRHALGLALDKLGETDTANQIRNA